MAVEQLTFTALPRGKGVDAAQQGYQIAACSSGLPPDARAPLSSICMHYGHSVYRLAPLASMDQETEWRKTTATLDAVPEAVLTAFPVVWSYDRLSERAFALTLIRYAGLTYAGDDRLGNFFCHSLVFDPDERRGHERNTLALTRAAAFQSPPNGETTALPALDGFGGDITAAFEPGAVLLRQPEFAPRVASLVAALVAAPAGRPLLLALRDRAAAAALLETLLELLPPYARARTTFCTNEADRSPALPKGLAAHDVVVRYTQDGRPPDVRPDECRTAFAVFNFAGGQFSELGAPGAYASFAAAAVTGGGRDRLDRLHTLIERLEVGHLPQAWDALVPVVDLIGGSPQAESVTDALRVFEDLAKSPAQARAAVEMLMPHVERLARAGDAAGLDAAAPGLALLVDRMPADAVDDIVSRWTGLVVAAIAARRGRAAAALLRSAGRARQRVLVAALGESARAADTVRARANDASDRLALIDLCVEGIELSDAVATLPARWLLSTASQIAHDNGTSADLWRRIGADRIARSLADPWDADKQALALELRGWFPPDLVPEASAAINLRLLRATRPQGDELVARLTELARACGDSPALQSLPQELIQAVEDSGGDPVSRAVLIGRMADAAPGTPAGDPFADAYHEAMARLEPDERKRGRQALAAQGAARILGVEVLEDLATWDDQAPARFQSWWDVALKQPQVYAQVCATAATQLQPGRRSMNMLGLAEALLSKQSARAAGGAALVALWDAVAVGLTFDGESESRLAVLGAPPPGASSEAARRVAVVRLLVDLRQKAKHPAWSVTQFPHTDAAWRAVRDLAPDERGHIVSTAIDHLSVTGVTSPADVDAFLQMLDAAGISSEEEIAGAFDRLTRGRDPVTCVLVAMHLVGSVLGRSRSPARYGPVLRALLARWDRNTSRLFEAHLAGRFGRRDPKEDRRLEDLCEAAGLRAPEAPAPPGSQSGRGRAPQADAPLLAKMKSLGRKLWQ